jgi:uncharacterized protein involved in type VI secretion and phage assembly
MSEFDLFSDVTDGDRARCYGVVTAVVTSNQDPDQQGKVKIKLPGMTDDETGPWARVAVLMGGGGRGTFFLPEQGDEVLVAFDNGNLKLPYIIGGLWSSQDKPPDVNADGKNNKRFIKSRSGHLIRFDDTAGSEKVEIIDKSGNNSVTFDAANNSVTINSAKDITISAPNGTITLSAKTISISSLGDSTVAATGKLALQASQKTTIKGTTVDIN